MRLRKIDRYLLLLAALFVVAVLKRTDLPGEEVLPDVYRATVYRPLLAQAAAAANDGALDLVALRSELAAKDREIDELKAALAKTRELAKYFNAMKWQRPPEAINGWVFAVDPNPFRCAFRIDLGSNDRVEPGMPVVNGKALLGTIATVQRRQSIVTRVDDPNFRMEIEIHPAREGTHAKPIVGIARGDGDRGLEIRLVRFADTLQTGDPVYTTSYHERIPPGLVVGWIDQIKDLDEDGSAEIVVTPAAALGRWARINVLKVKNP